MYDNTLIYFQKKKEMYFSKLKHSSIFNGQDIRNFGWHGGAN